MSCSTAKLLLMPAPLTVLPCTYSRRTLGPMPLGQTPMTLMLAGNLAPTLLMWPSRKPCDRPSVAPGLRFSKTFSYTSACAASEISSSTRSDSRITSNISPRVPLSRVKPALRACCHRRRAGAQADLDLDACAFQRVAQVLRLRRPLRAPADDADLLDALERLGQQREQVPAARTICSVWPSRSSVSTSNTFDLKLSDSGMGNLLHQSREAPWPRWRGA